MKTLLTPAPARPGTHTSGVLIIDKPSGWTSHDVVAKVRNLLKTRKVGHTGTLDPMGTGVLPICVGDATKLAGFAQMADKVYQVTMRLGVSTDTQDSTGEVTATHDLDPALDWDRIVREQLAGMVGKISQIPPMYAAVKIDGEALYKKARRGETVERPPREITVYGIDDISVELPEVHFTLSCSKGTYVRTVASDVGDALGVGAHLTALSRTACGPLTLDESITLDDLAEAVAEGRIEDVLKADDYLLGDRPILKVSEYTRARMVQGISPHISEWSMADGGRFDHTTFPEGTLCRVYGEKCGFFALAETGTDPGRPAKIRRIVKPNAA
ncbi:MAG: tRNA pseudouridine(55) synthase TruB [Leptospirillia bacterium]